MKYTRYFLNRTFSNKFIELCTKSMKENEIDNPKITIIKKEFSVFLVKVCSYQYTN